MPMGFIPRPSPSWPTWAVILYYVIVAVVLFGSLAWLLLKAFPYLKRGRAGIKTRRGTPRKHKDGRWMRVGPGIHPQIPFIDDIEDECILDRVCGRNSVLADNVATGLQCVADLRPIWRICDDQQSLHDALFKAADLENMVETIVMSAVGEAVQEAADYLSRSEIKRLSQEFSRESLNKYGVVLIDIGLESVRRIPLQLLASAVETKHADGADAVREATAVAYAAATETT